MEKKKHYIYDGPIIMFGRCIANRWIGETWAETSKKAKNNLAYQYKKSNNLLSTGAIMLSSPVEEITE